MKYQKNKGDKKMEKRNFVTSMRTNGESSGVDGMVEKAASLFGGGKPCEKKAESDFAKKASAEDEKTDSLS